MNTLTLNTEWHVCEYIWSKCTIIIWRGKYSTCLGEINVKERKRGPNRKNGTLVSCSNVMYSRIPIELWTIKPTAGWLHFRWRSTHLLVLILVYEALFLCADVSMTQKWRFFTMWSNHGVAALINKLLLWLLYLSRFPLKIITFMRIWVIVCNLSVSFLAFGR